MSVKARPVVLMGVVVVAFAAGTLVGASATDKAPRATTVRLGAAEVASVDGDTLLCLPAKPLVTRVRLAYVNAVERATPLGPAATAALEKLAAGRHLVMLCKTTGTRGELRHDDNGRLLAQVRAGGKDVGLEMVKVGLARYWADFGRAPEHEAYVAAQEAAKAKRLGLWALEPAITGTTVVPHDTPTPNTSPALMPEIPGTGSGNTP